MPDINQKRLDQMIENALSYEQSIPPEGFNPWAKKFKYLISKPIITSIAFASFVFLVIFQLPTQRPIFAEDVDEIYDLVMFEIFDDV